MLIRLRYAALSAVIVALGAGLPAAIATGAVKVGYTQASRPDTPTASPLPPSSATAPQAGGVPAGSAPQSPPGRPANWLQLYRESAAEYCPGLSWTVLAAIGEIESGDGANDGPSTAGALGPMQFLASTWRIWGTDGFGQNGPPDIMNPLDAVPSAARMLCADGAAQGGAALSAAIFDYNHATWYVNEVLAMAGEYAQEYP